MEFEDKYKTFWARFFAGIIDGIVLLIVYVAMALLVPEKYLNEKIMSSVMYILSTLYFTICHWRFGRTLGKKMNGVIVLDVSEKKYLSLSQSMTREVAGWLTIINMIAVHFVHIAPFITAIILKIADFWYPIEVLTMLSNEKRRAIHDFLAKSVVVHEKYVFMLELENTRKKKN